MSRGVPLDGRGPLALARHDRPGAIAGRPRTTAKSVVVSCSALKKAYRDRLRQSAAGGSLAFVYLKGSRDLLTTRMAARHAIISCPSSLLDSQLATLEDPSGEAGVVTVDIDAAVEAIVADAFTRLSALR
jgi:gluconokinase